MHNLYPKLLNLPFKSSLKQLHQVKKHDIEKFFETIEKTGLIS